MKKLLGIVVLGILLYLAHVYEAQSCKKLVKDLKLTGNEAKDKYEECKKF